MPKVMVDFYKLVNALSTALDLIGAGIRHHHIRVALIARQIATELNLSENEINEIVYAALVHDVGISTFKEKAALLNFEIKESYTHCVRGHYLLQTSTLLKPLAKIVLCHHDRWSGANKTGLQGTGIPLASRIIHLVDRVDILIDDNQYILDQRELIINNIKKMAGQLFDPYLVDEFLNTSQKPSFWLDLAGGQCEKILLQQMNKQAWQGLCQKNNCKVAINLEELLNISEIFAQVIDAKSNFTHRHSKLVADVSTSMAVLLDFSEAQCQTIKIASLLHDLGKLAIPESILEKPGVLTNTEMNLMKSHTYYTYRILELVPGFEQIKEWAAYHHECLNGSGYPFGIKTEDLSTESRMMAISDIFAALVEDRPYRQGMPRHQVEKILLDKVARQHLDGQLVELLLDNYDQLLICKESV